MPAPLRRLICLALLTAGLADGWADERKPSLASTVPAEIGLFVEGHRLGDLLLPLTDPQAWLALAEFAGQPARPEEAAQWRDRVRHTVGMEPAQAINTLLGEHVAFVGPGPGRAQDAVVLCRPVADKKQLLAKWNAQPLPTAGRTSIYRLAEGVGLALPDDLFMFGDATAKDGVFARMLEFIDARPAGGSLAEDPTYESLLKRVPRDPDAVLFARLRRAAPSPEASGARPGGNLPGPLRGAANVLLALHRGDGLLHFNAVGDAPVNGNTPRTGLTELVQRLPARTLAIWAMHLDYAALLDSLDRLSSRSALRLAFALQERAGTGKRLVESLGSATCLALGAVEPAARMRPAPPLPALAVLVRTSDAQNGAAALERLLQDGASAYNLLALQVGAQPMLLKVEHVEIAGLDVHLLDLSGLLGRETAGQAIGELHLCWTLDGETLILASHLDWMRQILGARRRDEATAAAMLNLARKPLRDDVETVLAVQAGPIADLGEMWLTYLAHEWPDVLSEDWWRVRQPGGGDTRLGIQVTELGEQQRLRVASVTPNSPADGVLRPGDEIVGCNRQRFATTQPIREIRAAIEQRPDARWVELLVARGSSIDPRRVPLPFVDPVRLLRRAITAGRIMQRVVYAEDTPEPAGARGTLTVELRRSAAPLFPFQLTPAVQPGPPQAHGQP